MAYKYTELVNVIRGGRGGRRQSGRLWGTSKGGFWLFERRGEGGREGGGGRVGSGECSGCGFMMVAVQGWRDVSGGMGFVLGREVSGKDRGW